ncbi:tol-pal system protein YbgF [[Pseudomonas] carboxydohydrogena]|uniref:Cell division coordinator CpoB n=1 Tax=Afipia carboxydohydrogena TaxID=290 RepID=A0ABY8BSE7_AFICR|nr:tol-pal system protein YbgF [[Pseudomonas] carboxydohydrogena]WEF51242.1 tol-pal system protein YbgF [[Pseudomonas] carboxydohydrogena]
MSSKPKIIAAAGLACAFVVLSPLAMPMQAHAQQYDSGDPDPQAEVDRLSDQLRKLTGQNEELQHRNQVLEEQLRQLQGGAAPGAAGASPARGPANAGPAPYQNQNQQYQNQPYQNPQYQQSQQPAYQGQQGAPITTPYNDGQAPSPGRRGDAFDPSQNPSAPGAPRALGSMRGQSNYAEPGSAQPGAPMNIENNNYGNNSGVAPPPSNPGGGLTTAPPTRSPKDEFDLGLGYMQHKDYGLAEETMRNFTVKYPGDRLVGDAQYWLGESLYQRKKYREAAEAFLAVTSKYDKSAKAPDAMLRLGESLAALKEKDAACAAFGEVARKYPRASSGVKQGVARGQKRSGC